MWGFHGQRSRTSQESKPYPSRLVLQSKEHKVLVKLPASPPGGLHRYLQRQAVQLFSDVGTESTNIAFWTSEVPEWKDEEIEISPDTLPEILDDGIRKLVVKVRPDTQERKVVSRCSSSSSEPEPTQEVKANEPATPSQPSGNDTLKISVFNTATEKTVELKAKPSLKIQKIMEVLKAHYGIPCDDQRLYYDGERVLPDDTLGSLGVENGDQLELMPVLKGAKPVIYLYPTTATRISTTLSLVPEWEFSAIYPVVPAKSTENGQELKWVVDAQPSGILTEVATGMEVSYLYWEAETTGKGLVSPPLSPIPGATTVEAPFVPNRASLDSKDTVLLEVAKITPYLDGALKALGLHVEARTSFVTYWLPTLLKHEYVALRFLPQSAYEHAAPLKIDPIPDVVSRIFMLFKGVDKSDLAVWSEARERAVEDVGRWTDVVGVDVEKVQDAGLFRVIEWGGMEVLV